MIDEITLMKYADGTLTSEEKKEVEKEIQNNPEYLKIISNFKKSRDILLDVSEGIKSEELPASIKKIHKKIKRKIAFQFKNILEYLTLKTIALFIFVGTVLVFSIKKLKLIIIDFFLRSVPTFRGIFDDLISFLPI